MKPQHFLTILRIPLAIIMFLFVYVDRYIFLLFLVLSGLTDFFDGYIARKRQEASAKGAFLDGIADYVFYPLLYASAYILSPELFIQYSYLVVIAIVWALLNIIVLRARLGEFVIFHLHTMRVSVFAAVVFMVLLVFDMWVEAAFLVTIGLFLIRNAEETLVYFKADKTTDPDVRFFWRVKRKR